MSDENMSNIAPKPKSFSGLNIILVALLVLIAVIVGWFLGKESEPSRTLNFLPPKDGVLDYYLSTNVAQEPLPYTPAGMAWNECPEDVCEIAPLGKAFNKFLDSLVNTKGFILLPARYRQFSSTTSENNFVDVPFISKAHAATSGCYPVAIISTSTGKVTIYNKPGCP